MFLVTFNRIYPIAKMNIESTAVLEFLSGSILIPILLSWILELKNKPLNEKKARKFFLVIERKSAKGNINNKYSVRLIQKVSNFLLSIKRSQSFWHNKVEEDC